MQYYHTSMKKLLRIITGCTIVLFGLAVVIVSSRHTLHGQLIWISVIIIGTALVWTGIRVVTGDKIRHILKDLLTIFIW